MPFEYFFRWFYRSDHRRLSNDILLNQALRIFSTFASQDTRQLRTRGSGLPKSSELRL